MDLNNPIMRQIVKSALPLVSPILDELITMGVDYLKSIELEGDETHVSPVIEIDNENGKSYIVVGAFVDKVYSRTISVHETSKLSEQLITLLKQHTNGISKR